MTKLQKASIERIKVLIDGLNLELPVRLPYFPEDFDRDKVRELVADKDRVSVELWQHDDQAKAEIIRLVEALLAEPDDEDGE